MSEKGARLLEAAKENPRDPQKVWEEAKELAEEADWDPKEILSELYQEDTQNE